MVLPEAIKSNNLLCQLADVAAAPLMVTLSREKAVDFLFPFYSFEAAILMRERHPSQEPVIRNLEDLVNQKEVDFGTLKHGAIAKVMSVSIVKVSNLLKSAK